MDLRILGCLVFCALVIACTQGANTTEGHSKTRHANGTVKCCKPGTKGEKGERGVRGHRGQPGTNATRRGEKGMQGPQGFQGLIGAPGMKGRKGEKGPVGPTGLTGPVGIQGPMGTPATHGQPGMNGSKGEKGDKGTSGLKGPRGLTGSTGVKGEMGAAGIPGTCGCERLVTNPVYQTYGYNGNGFSGNGYGYGSSNNTEWGTQDKPGIVTCRNAPITQTGTHYIFPGPMKVLCNFDTKQTCVQVTANNKEVTFKETAPFWLSQKNVSWKDIYGLESHQISWLQRESSSASLTIRYHCKNSNPVGFNASMLLTWNDMKIGPVSTPSSPFHYSVPTATDGCSRSFPNEWSFTDIVLDTPAVQRLPIIDILINDVRNDDQAVRIEIREMCFG